MSYQTNLPQIHHSDEGPIAGTRNSDTFKRNATFAASPQPEKHVVAVKVVRCPTDKQVDILQVFTTHILTWLSLDHPNLCRILGLYTMERGLTSIVKPFFERGNVLQCLSQLTPAMKGHIIKGIASGLLYLHRHNLVHANLCPTNILITEQGDACISDAGINHLVDLTTGGGRVKIPFGWPYKAPEELLPQTPLDTRPTRAMDTFSFASTAYEILTGRPPYCRIMHYRGLLEVINHGNANISQPAQINRPMWSIIQKCWNFNPISRPFMATVLADLETVQFR